jgi:two-component system, sensor histidine kinase and response regulator
VDFFINLFDTSDFPRRWDCGSWTPAWGWLHILSDLDVWSAYVTIPCVIGIFLARKKDVPFRTVSWLFVAFILFCGTTHLMEAVIFWWPAYRLAGLLKLLTALVSWATVIALVPVVPRALASRSPRELEQNLLDFSKIEAGKLELDPADFSLRAALGDTVRILAMRAYKKGLELVCNVQPGLLDAVIGDAPRLRQVLLNLIGNAIKFTEKGEMVVRVEADDNAAPEGQVGLRFVVSDTGIGIPPEKHETIFRAFEQEDTSTTRKYGGTGLGLTIVTRLVALMGGTIMVESEPGRGSTFTFTARFGRQPSPAEPVATRRPDLLDNLPVLIVDDNATNRRILEEWLRGWKMEPVARGDGLAALDAIWQGVASGRTYPLVLLVARMPDTDGLTLAATIRERVELASTRIILLTSGDFSGDLDRHRELGIDAQLLKPVQQDELLETIYRVMSRDQADSPTADRPAPAEETRSAPPPAMASLHILVAEDNEFNAQLLEQLLLRRGHRVRVASNGREALALAQDGVFDLLLRDVHIPELDGFQVVSAVRERERTSGRHLPVIALTARSKKEDRERCLAAGMDDFLSKPVQGADLGVAIGRIAAAHLPAEQSRSGLLNPRVLWDVCGCDAAVLARICQAGRPVRVGLDTASTDCCAFSALRSEIFSKVFSQDRSTS